MKGIIRLFLACMVTVFMYSCSSSVNVIDSWKAEPTVVEKFKERNVLVIARTADNYARIAVENEFKKELSARGIKATSSFTRMPMLNKNREMTEERLALIRTILESEGYDAIVLMVVKDKSQVTRTTSSGIYVGATYNNYYPGYYGGFYNYYSYPYAYGSYYNSFGGYIPTSTSTRTYSNYVLETVAYNLDAADNDQLVAVVTTSVEDPRDLDKAATKYVAAIIKSLENK
jgi:hypothetical protein